MPPKNLSAITSSKVATKSTAATKASTTSDLVAANIMETKSNTKKRAASGPPEAERTTLDKKVRLAGEGLILLANSPVPQKEFSAGKGTQLSEEILVCDFIFCTPATWALSPIDFGRVENIQGSQIYTVGPRPTLHGRHFRRHQVYGCLSSG